MGHTLSKPVTCVQIERSKTNCLYGAYANMNGIRKNNEDAHVFYSHDDTYINGVFDGHGGDKCAKFIADNLPKKIMEIGLKKDNIVEACIQLDKKFFETHDNDSSGTTATFSIIKKKDDKYIVTVCNIGDSFTLVLKRNDENINLSFTSKEHKPSEPIEELRIREQGGVVINNRINNGLAVSRAFGDKEYKMKGTDSFLSQVIAIPDIEEFECDEGDIIIHICDGITERKPIDDIVKIISENIDKHDDMAILSSIVCLKALESGSADNLSCMILKLGDYSKQSYDSHDLVVGPFYNENPEFINAYRLACEYNGITFADALKKRLDLIEKFEKKYCSESEKEKEKENENEKEKSNLNVSMTEKFEDILLEMEFIRPTNIEEEKKLILRYSERDVAT
ncbi:serine/threonine-protein phosphatase [Bodo saltans virus]|uniref:protein-serine/threonine phosphatase n=1 Tax=Bodo saltans virus TaxID=2024608 RepID=A0A2H4UU75_9VIRU|nr:serine/threonine-protein phosphatase [Bodo saltans virus]ATZ80389.1 serine/threonine-protein phosphatase [Bodo saltans virus]